MRDGIRLDQPELAGRWLAVVHGLLLRPDGLVADRVEPGNRTQRDDTAWSYNTRSTVAAEVLTGDQAAARDRATRAVGHWSGERSWREPLLFFAILVRGVLLAGAYRPGQRDPGQAAAVQVLTVATWSTELRALLC